MLASESDNEKSLSTSISGMVQLLETEEQLIDSVEKYAEELQKKVDALKILAQELKAENQKSLNKREEYLYNPLNGFALIRRMYNDWPKIELFMSKPVGEVYLEVIRNYRPEMPTATDLAEASEALNRLQTVYDLRPADMVKGILNGKQYNASLKSIDSYFMGYYLFSKNLYYPAGFWLYNSIINYEELNNFNSIVDFGKEKPLELYADILVKQNRPKDALSSITQASDLLPTDARLLNRKNEIQQLANTYDGPAIHYPPPVVYNYERGCRGHFSNVTSKMYCIYNTTASAFLRLAPIKMEIIHLEPYMVIFHDVISDQEIEHLKNLARPNLKRATVYNDEKARSLVVNTRTSKFSWFQDNTDEITKRINQRIIDMTGFDIVGSEMLQVMNYGLGGHYDKHFDFFNVTQDTPVVAKEGDRISTVLFYLSDVEQGGATVFPNIQTAVFPRKGSAVMWYNLNNKVEGDAMTLHAACPVIVGSKWVFLIITNEILINAEYYSSVHKMSALMNAELQILNNMETFIRKNENKLEFLKERLKDYEREHEKAVATVPVFFENPVNKYILTKRLTKDWEKIENLMQYQEGEDLLKKIEKHSVKENEFEGAIDGLLRLQDTYRLNTTDIAQGILKGISYNVSFNSRHCYDIGQRALATNLTRLAHSWLKEALNKISTDSEIKLEKLDIELAVINAKYKLGDISGANQTYVDLINFYPDSERIAKLYVEFLGKSKNKTSIKVDYSIDHEPPVIRFKKVNKSILHKYTCADLIRKTPSEERQLRCRYMTETNPFLRLAPIKLEEMNHDPLLVVFHDVISDQEIAIVKNLTTRIRRAKIFSGNKSTVSEVRTSQFTFIKVHKHPVLSVIDRRIEDMTNLNMKYSEDHQVANYGIGGHYGPHRDYFSLLHLTDVEQGGGTAFPYMKQHLLPKKGSAAFWYNLHASGVRDKRTLHGACPIVVGSKWVLNRWIREHGQSDRRPCPLVNDSL
ncbi:Prolyl 4-hydroxylase subunit alpha-2 [Lucilia cuprina]|nr:Prolyl 4-hydroxylase subunit alpha-2 [Lucilia cuprina]